MFNFDKKLPRWTRKHISPSPNFVQKTKTQFLAVFDAHEATLAAADPTRANAARTGSMRSGFHFTFAVRLVVAIIAFFGIMAGASVYADTANVPADNVLYPLKRLGENVQLTLAAPATKPQLQATFALRRADEISDLKTRKPSSTLITGLAGDLNTDVDASISDSQTSNLQDGKLNNFCNTLFPAVVSSSDDLVGSARVRSVIRFEKECGQASSTAIGMSASTTFKFPFPSFGNASGTASSSSLFPSSTNPRGGRGLKGGNGGSGGRGGNNSGSGNNGAGDNGQGNGQHGVGKGTGVDKGSAPTTVPHGYGFFGSFTGGSTGRPFIATTSAKLPDVTISTVMPTTTIVIASTSPAPDVIVVTSTGIVAQTMSSTTPVIVPTSSLEIDASTTLDVSSTL